jgi:hypothetical protein
VRVYSVYLITSVSRRVFARRQLDGGLSHPAHLRRPDGAFLVRNLCKTISVHWGNRAYSVRQRTLTPPFQRIRRPAVAHELFEIQTKTNIHNSLQVIDILLDQDPTQGRDFMIHEQVRLIRELVGLTRYVRPSNDTWIDPMRQ